MFRRLLCTLLLLLFSVCLLYAQQSDFPLGWANRDASKTVSVIGRNVNYPIYYDKVFYQSATGNSPSFTFPDYGTIQYGLGSCVVGNKRMQWWVEYQIDGGAMRSSYTVNPEVETGTKTVIIHARNYRKTSCTGGGETTYQTAAILTVKFERPEWIGLDEIKTVCNNIDKDYNLRDNFSVTDGVTFYLDNTSNPITIFNPKDLSPGFHKLIARKQYDNGTPDPNWGSRPGIVTFEFEFQVLEGIKLVVDPYPATMCQNDPPYPVKVNPTGGQWDGRGMDAAGNFTPASAFIGRNLPEYSITSPNGCVSKATLEIFVNTIPDITVSDMEVCRTAAAFPLTVGTPTGGTYSGRGVVNGTHFDPGQALVGRNLIRYTYTNAAGCTTYEEFYITVLDADNFSVGEDFTTCNTSATTNLNERADVSPDDGSIVWSGPGVIGGKYFSPAAAGIGTHAITATLYLPTTGCTYTKTLVITVNQGPAITAGPDISVCQNAAPFRIAGGTPGGTWSGEHITSNTFTPSGALPGDYIATITLTTASCVVTASKTISVYAPPVVSVGPSLTICRNGGPAKLPTPSHPGGSWSADGSYHDAGNGTVDPLKMKIGDNHLVYTYTDGICTVETELIITVTLPPVVDAGPDLQTCINATAVTLPGEPAGWSGPGVEDGRFIQTRAGTGEHLLTYQVTDALTGCSNSDFMYMRVNAAPVVDAGPDLVICRAGGDVYLGGIGTWSGSFTDGGYFRATTAPLGNYTLTLSYTDPSTGCSGSDSRIVQLVDAPTLSVGPDIAICDGAPKFAPPTPSHAGGTWSALAGGFYDAAANLNDPEKMQLGQNSLVYTLITPAGCAIRDTMVITKHPKPVVNAMRDFSVCLNAAAVPLVGEPAGAGIWDGNGVSNNAGNFFIPSDAGAGRHVLNFLVTDQATGCSNQDSTIVTVHGLPVITMPADSSICVGGPSFPVPVKPGGGVLEGAAGIIGLNFSPAAAGVGTHQLTYRVTDASTRCSNTGTVQYQVKGLPGSISLAGDTIQCAGATVQLTASAANTTSFDWFRENENTPFATGTTIRYKISQDEKLIVKPKPVNTGDCEGPGRIFSITSNTPIGSIRNMGGDTLPFGSLFRVTADVEKTIQYRWDFGDSGYSTQQEGNHYYYTPGQHTVYLEATGAMGCRAKFSLPPIYVLDENGKVPDPIFDRGTGEDNGAAGLNVYPTTFANRLTVECLLKQAQTVMIEFYDFSGRKLSEVPKTGITGANKFVLDDAGQLPGHGVWIFIKITSSEINKTLPVFKL